MLHDYTTTTPGSIAADVDAAIAAADVLAAGVVDADVRTYATVLDPLERVGMLIGDAYGRSAFMGHVHPDPEVRDAGLDAEERLAKYGSDLVFRRDLYEAVDGYAVTGEAAGLAGTRKRLLEFTMRDLRRAGHELAERDRDDLQRMQNRLIELQVAFSKNLADWEDHLDLTREDLDGLPDDYIDRLSPGDAPGTFRVSMDYPEYTPFMQQAKRRDLRRQLQYKFWNRAADANKALLGEAVDLRHHMARLLGYPTWSHYAMEVKMAEIPDRVREFYDGLVPRLRDKGAAELQTMAALLEADSTGERLEAWDSTYYDNEQRRRDFGVDQNLVAEYFPLDGVVAGMFDITGEVFGLSYEKIDDARAWHPDVSLYRITDTATGEPIAFFYADLFPREGKYGHAAAFNIVYGRRRDDGTYERPVAAIVANFTKPTADSPSLLKHPEALTLFHEFGHILHFCLTTVDIHRFSGYDTELDFVEAPSQIMEHWMWKPEVLARFARHHRTGEPIPADLVERLVAARDLNVGTSTLRQMFLGTMDLALHAAGEGKDLDAIYRDAYHLTGFPFHEGTFFPASFGHLMGGYDAGYYGYLWSKVYGDDMFSVFEAQGVTSPEVGRRYREEILAAGGSRDAADHLRAFLGREPNSDAFLRNLGLG